MILKIKHHRVRCLAIVMLIGVSLLVLRLFQIQILSHAKYTEMARKEQVKTFVIPAKRGLIYAMDGENSWSPLVMNETVYTVFVDPRLISQPDKLKAKLETVAKSKMLEPNKFDQKIKNTKSRYQVVASGLSRQEAEELKQVKLKGVGFQAQTRRVYPEGSLAAQVLGFVNANGGQYGVEGGLNQRLAGQDGRLESVTDVADVPLTIGDKNVNTPAVDGDNLVLSIDKNIQLTVERAIEKVKDQFGADKLSVLVLNPNNGQIMASANWPSYNPREFFKVKDPAVFNNSCLMEPYEVGSVMKSLTFAAALSDKIIRPESRFLNTDVVQVGDRQILNAYRGITGDIMMRDAIRYSLNTGMVEILARAGGGQINRQSRDWLFKYFNQNYALGQKTGIELPEAAGRIIAPDKIEGNAVRYANMTFGQGLDVTMLQMTSAFAAAINGGTYYQPSVLKGHLGESGELVAQTPVVKRLGVVSPEASLNLREVLSWARHSTSQGKDDLPGFEIGGKTGTSETLRDGKYVRDETIASYLGYAGGQKPEFVIMTRVSGTGKSMEGNVQAVALFNELANWIIGYLRIQPKEVE